MSIYITAHGRCISVVGFSCAFVPNRYGSFVQSRGARRILQKGCNNSAGSSLGKVSKENKDPKRKRERAMFRQITIAAMTLTLAAFATTTSPAFAGGGRSGHAGHSSHSSHGSH